MALLAAKANPNVADQYGYTPLHMSSHKGYAAVVELLLKADADPHASNQYGATPLHTAALNGHSSVVMVLLAAHVEPNAVDKDQCTPLHHAASRDSFDVARLLLNAGASLKATNAIGDTPLHIACYRGNNQLVSTLLEAGDNIRAKNKYGFTPLSKCLQEGCVFTQSSLQTLQVLVSFGATWDNKCDEIVDSGKARDEAPALQVCVLLWTQERADGLPFTDIPIDVMKTGVDATKAYAAAKPGTTHLVETRGADGLVDSTINAIILGNSQKLLKASKEDDILAVLALLRTRRVNVNASDEYGITPLHLASVKDSRDIVNLLLQANANPHLSNKAGWTALHGAASNGRVEIVKALLTANADPNAVAMNGDTPLFEAAKGHAVVAELLLKAGGNPNAINWTGRTPLFIAVVTGHFSIVKILLEANADPTLIDKDGWTPLHHASFGGHLEVVKRLVTIGVNTNAANKEGDSPLHLACYRYKHEVGSSLLASGASILVENKDKLKPLQKCIQKSRWAVTNDTLLMLQVLIAFGARWDITCDEMVASGNARDEAPALCTCMLLWMEEHAAGLPLTKIPIEVVKRGAASTQTYIDERKRSKKSTFRRKICVIGPSQWGKTTLIKSLATGTPSLHHPDDRTVGIDIFSLDLGEYAITFWDFAGQDDYQPAHAIFFSERTMSFVCVDLHSSSLAKTQADFRADSDVDFENRMDEFVATKILRWIRLVFARQPDAEFVVIGTKADAIRHNIERIKAVQADLTTRLEAYATAYRDDVSREIDALRNRALSDNLETLERLHKQKANATNMAPKVWLTMSCKEKQWVRDATNDLQRLLEATKERSFEMPESYSKVLDAIVETRSTSSHERSRQRVHNTFVSYGDLEKSLTQRMPEVTTRCREIVRTLHDLGDVLWYEHLGTERFQNTVILDPLMLIDFIRQIFDHNYNGETMSHKTLVERPYWVDIATDSNLVCALKRMLQHFHLVYPSSGKMEWDSELMVPSKWRTNLSSYRQVAGLPLQLERGEASKHVRWNYLFTSELPDAVYDHFVVATYSSIQKRVVGPYGIFYSPTKNNMFACRAMLERKGRFTNIRLEALAGEGAKWSPFQRLIKGMETVLKDFPGLLVTRDAVTSEDDRKKLEVVVADAQDCDLSEIDWLPPDLTWYENLRAV